VTGAVLQHRHRLWRVNGFSRSHEGARRARRLFLVQRVLRELRGSSCLR